MDLIVAAVVREHEDIEYLTETELVKEFNKYTKSFDGFKSFCKEEFSWRRPNTSMLRFRFDPQSGFPIDWDKIFEENKDFLHDKNS
ncbi:MAG: hypothetical protein J6W16_01335 [Methanobrevibacter sp.]|nr:hypothetical protein [Methanobrevibacter sp.]